MASYEEMVKAANDLMMDSARVSDGICRLRIMVIELDPALSRSAAAPGWEQQVEYGTGEKS